MPKEKTESWKRNLHSFIPTQRLMVITELELTPYEIALFMVIFNFEILYGQCKLNTRNLAVQSGMALGTVVKTKKSLKGKGLIKIKKEKSELNEHDMDVIKTFITDEKMFESLMQPLDGK